MGGCGYVGGCGFMERVWVCGVDVNTGRVWLCQGRGNVGGGVAMGGCVLTRENLLIFFP